MEEDIRTYKTDENPHFSVLATSNHEAKLFQNNSQETLLQQNYFGNIAPSIGKIETENSTNWLLGKQYNDPSWTIFNEQGEKLASSYVQESHDRGAFITENLIFTTSRINSKIQDREGNVVSNPSLANDWFVPKIAQDIDEDGKRELLMKTASNTLYLYLDDNQEAWRISDNPPRRVRYLSDDRFVSTRSGSVSVRFFENGSVDWFRSISPSGLPAVKNDVLAVPTEENVTFLDRDTGSFVDGFNVSEEVSELESPETSDLLIGIQGNNVSVFDSGEQLQTRRFVENLDTLKLADSSDEFGAEVMFTENDKLHLLGLNGTEEEKSLSSFQRGLIQASRNGSVALDPEVNTSSDKTSFYADTRIKQVYAAALAPKENATLTFDKDSADRDFSDYSVKDLKDSLISRYEPNHVAVADLDSSKGVLAAFMAVKQGILPVDFDHEREYSRADLENISVKEFNQDNGVLHLKSTLESNFVKIGLNREIITEGQYVSILDGPRKAYKDPVEKGLTGDQRDGKYFFSDQFYGDLNHDKRLEAGVGRYPDNLTLAAEMFNRSLERDIGGKAVVGSEYLSSRWPVILANFGGGMWHSKNTAYSMENQDYNVTRLVEYRAQPVALIADLTGAPTKLDIFINGMKASEKKISEYLGEASFKAVKNAAMLIRSLQHAEQTLEIYLEYDWRNWQPFNDIDIPSSASREEVGDLIRSLLPERYDKLNSTALKDELPAASAIYYNGVGDQKRWVMPSENKGLNERYKDENNFSYREIPSLESPIVWDNSDKVAIRSSEMKESFLESGTASYIGASTVNYNSYSSVAARNYFRHGKTTGKSLKNALNDLGSNFIVPSTDSIYRTGVLEKMSRSLQLYGNPETPKDPVTEQGLEYTTECSPNTCSIEYSIESKYNVSNTGSGKAFSFDADSYLLQESMPITPLYKSSFSLPAANVTDISVKSDYRFVENTSRTEFSSLTSSGNSLNLTRNYTGFPEKKYRIEKLSGRIEHIQAASIYYSNGSAKILENVDVEVEYRPEVQLELKTENREPSVKMSEEVDSLYYSIDGEHFSIQNPEREQRLAKLDPGVHSVEVHAVRDDREVAYREEKVRIKEPLNVNLFAPDVRVNSERKAVAMISNPNSFNVSREFELDTTDKVQLGFLEKPGRNVYLRPDETMRVEWRLTGYETGNSTIGLENSTVDVTVLPAISSKNTFSASRLFNLFKSEDYRFEFSQSSSGLEATLSSKRGRMELRESPGFRKTRLVTDSFKISRNESIDSEKMVFENRTDYFESSSSGITTSGLSRESLISELEIFEREVSKLDERVAAVRP